MVCGIAGLVGANVTKSQAFDLVQRMLGSMKHRGPDGREVESASWATVGAVRLAVMDRAEVLARESSGQRASILARDTPGGTTLGLNGQVYNYSLLGSKAACSQGKGGASPDVQHVLSHYAEQGLAGLGDLRGEFSIAISDRRSRMVHLVRDPFGIKPLYWARSHGGIAFASEASALLLLSDVTDTWDPMSLAMAMTFRAVPGDRTIYRDIHCVRASAATSLGAEGDMKITPLWDLAAEMRKPTQKDLGQAIVNSIEARCASDVPVGLFLSGGVDSGAIGRVAARSGCQLQTFTAVFPEQAVAQYSEGDKASRVAAEIGSEHHEVPITQKSYFAHLVASSSALDQPCADPAIPVISHLCQAADQSALVVLSGEGADELLSSYSIYADLEPIDDAYWGFGRLVTDQFRSEFLPTLNHQIGGGLQGFVEERWRYLPEDLGPRQRFCMIDTDAWLAGCLLTRLDNLTMRTGIEGRVPYLDWDVASAAVRMLSAPDVGEKQLLRELVRSHAGGDSADEPKRGLAVPSARWLDANRQDVISIIMAGPVIDVIPPIELRTLLDHLFSSGGNHEAQILHSLVVLSLFGSSA